MGFLHKVAWLGVMLLAGFGQASAATTAKDDSQAAIALLEKALAYYHDHGDKAFAAFSRQGEFVEKDKYVFVVDTKGTMLASGGPSSALIGRDVSEVLGPDLQKTFKDALKVPEGNGIQQAEYRWQNWSDGKVERKHVFYQRIGERILAVGYYLPRASAEQAKALLDKAATDLGKDEKGTLTAINSLKGGYLQDDLYVFVVDLNTQRYVAHGTNLRLINTDFADVKTVLSNAGTALMGTGAASGDNRAVLAANAAINSPLLEASLEGARGIVVNITGPSDVGLFEVTNAMEIVRGVAHQDANIIHGLVIDDDVNDEVRVTVVAAGFERWDSAVQRTATRGDGRNTATSGTVRPDAKGGRLKDLFGGASDPLSGADDDDDLPSFLK